MSNNKDNCNILSTNSDLPIHTNNTFSNNYSSLG